MKIGLVIEGGGFRGVFCEGITSFLIEQNIEIPYVIGVSMGAINGTNYLAKQPRRNLEIIEAFLHDKRYISKRNLIKTGNLFGMDFIFNDITYKHHPLDFETFNNSNQEFVIVSMNCETGESLYTKKSESTTQDMLNALKASTSLPFVSKQVLLNEQPCLDGGISDPIPVEQALRDGCDKLIVILTRDTGYVKAPFKGRTFGNLFYKNHPEVINQLSMRHVVYSDTLSTIDALEKEGKAMVFRPTEPLNVGRTEKDFSKIKYAFECGYEQAYLRKTELLNFLKK